MRLSEFFASLSDPQPPDVEINVKRTFHLVSEISSHGIRRKHVVDVSSVLVDCDVRIARQRPCALRAVKETLLPQTAIQHLHIQSRTDGCIIWSFLGKKGFLEQFLACSRTALSYLQTLN